MELKDKKITCKDCGTIFYFTVRDQKFYADNGYTNEPLRCKDCRQKKKAARNKFKKSATDYKAAA